jgi:hypothetical protein
VAAVIVACAIGLALAPRTPGAEETEISVADEYEIKAAFLVNFAKFVDWPQAGPRDAAAPIVIGIVGRDPFEGRLDAIAAGREADGRPIVIERFARIGDARRCHVLFVAGFERPIVEALLAGTVIHAGVLTVSDAPGFAAAGGIIELFVEGNKVRFTINMGAASAAGLAVSSRLAQLASPPPAVRAVRQ